MVILQENIKQEPPVDIICYLPEYQPENFNESSTKPDELMETKGSENEKNQGKAKKIFKCDFCSKTYSSNVSLQRHRESTHLFDGKFYECDKCSYATKLKKNLQIHFLIHTSPFECLHCDKKFGAKVSLQRHLKHHEGPQKFNCFCGRSFKTLRAIKIHRIKQHGSDRLVEKSFECNTCPYAAKFEYLLKRHVLTHMKFFTCDHCGQKYAKEKQLKEHLTKCRKLLDFSCKFCPKNFQNFKTLNQHLKSHAGREECPICFQMLSASFIKEHIRRHKAQQEKPKLECKICSKLFLTSTHLKLHKTTHNKRYECDFCGHRLAKKGVLFQHILVHVNPEIFKCIVCQKVFKDRSNLLAHNKRSHLKFQTKNEKCPICHQMFSSSFITKHIKMHEIKKKRPQFQCEICAQQFFLLHDLKLHKTSHYKRFECDFCGQKFTSKLRYFVEHLLKHINPDSFKCIMCQKLFTTKYSLKTHKKICRQY